MSASLKTILAAIAATLAASAANAAPINCATDKHPDEIAVCTIAGMVEVDRNVDGFYRELMGKLVPAKRAALRKSQREFLAERRKCGNETDCIRLTYRARSQELRSDLRDLDKRK
jgi:uncharacterized protein